MVVRRYIKTTIYFRLGVASLILTFAMHIVGFSLARWSVLNVSDVNSTANGVKALHHVGLWQHCSCDRENEGCRCRSWGNLPETFKEVHFLMVVGLSGHFISVLTSLALLFTKLESIRHDTVLAILNNAFVIASGIFTVVGVVLYAVECHENYRDLFSFVTSNQGLWSSINARPHLDIAFILCVIAGGTNICICSVILAIDVRLSARSPNKTLFDHDDLGVFTIHKQVFMKPDGPLDVPKPTYCVRAMRESSIDHENL